MSCFPAEGRLPIAEGREFFFFYLLNGGAETLRTGPRGRGLVRSATSLPSARWEAAGSRCRRSQLLTPNGGSSRSSRSMLMSAASTVICSIFNPRLPLAGQPWRGGQSQLGRGAGLLFCFNSTVTRTSPLEDVVDSIVSLSARRPNLANFVHILASC